MNSGDSGNLPAGTRPKGSIEIRTFRKCDQGVSEQVFIKNNGFRPRRIFFELQIVCPIVDSEFDEEMKKEKKLNLCGIRPRISETEYGFLIHFERKFGRRRRTPTLELQAAYGPKTPKDGEPVIRGLDIHVFLRPQHPRVKEFLEPVLTRVALYQGVQYNDWRDEEPGRMLHERRLNPQSETGKMNRNLYYGDVTSTPFWILSLSSLYRWTGDKGLIARHVKTIEKCIHWILHRLKAGHGFIYYAPAQSYSNYDNRNQAWKDSGDAIVDENGRICIPPLAVAEVQGYAYQALIEVADLFAAIDPHFEGETLRSEAKLLKERFTAS